MTDVPPTTPRVVYLRPGEAAEILCVHPKTVSNWGKAGKLRSYRTPGGQLRFPREAIIALYEGRIEDALPYPIGIPAQRTSVENEEMAS